MRRLEYPIGSHRPVVNHWQNLKASSNFGYTSFRSEDKKQTTSMELLELIFSIRKSTCIAVVSLLLSVQHNVTRIVNFK